MMTEPDIASTVYKTTCCGQRGECLMYPVVYQYLERQPCFCDSNVDHEFQEQMDTSGYIL